MGAIACFGKDNNNRSIILPVGMCKNPEVARGFTARTANSLTLAFMDEVTATLSPYKSVYVKRSGIGTTVTLK